MGGDLVEKVRKDPAGSMKILVPLRIQAGKCYGQEFFSTSTNRKQLTSFVWLDDRVFSRGHTMFTERDGFRKVILDQEARSKSYDFRQFILA